MSRQNNSRRANQPPQWLLTCPWPNDTLSWTGVPDRVNPRKDVAPSKRRLLSAESYFSWACFVTCRCSKCNCFTHSFRVPTPNLCKIRNMEGKEKKHHQRRLLQMPLKSLWEYFIWRREGIHTYFLCAISKVGCFRQIISRDLRLFRGGGWNRWKDRF